MKWYQTLGLVTALSLGYGTGCTPKEKPWKIDRIYQTWIEADNNPNTAERNLCIYKGLKGKPFRLITSQDGSEIRIKEKICGGLVSPTQNNMIEVKFNKLESQVQETIIDAQKDF